jgi:hypothetical protein
MYRLTVTVCLLGGIAGAGEIEEGGGTISTSGSQAFVTARLRQRVAVARKQILEGGNQNQSMDERVHPIERQGPGEPFGAEDLGPLALHASHCSTPLTATRYQQNSPRYTNNETGSKDRADHIRKRIFE